MDNNTKIEIPAEVWEIAQQLKDSGINTVAEYTIDLTAEEHAQVNRLGFETVLRAGLTALRADWRLAEVCNIWNEGYLSLRKRNFILSFCRASKERKEARLVQGGGASNE